MIALPASYLSLLTVSAIGWFGATPQAALITPSVQKAAQKLVQRVTFPAFIFQTLALTDKHSASLLSYCATIAGVAIVAHLILSSVTARFIFSKRSLRDRLLLSSLSAAHESEGLNIAFCAVVWGAAGAQAATVAACFSAVLGPLVAWLVYGSSPVGLPHDVKHRDGGVYNGEWSQGKKDGFGAYRYASGAKYEGSWKSNLKHGPGVYYYPSGGRFEGEFVDGKRSGVGVRLWPHGAAKAAVFDQDKMVRGAELPDAAQVMYRANESAAAARAVHTGGVSLAEAAKQAFLSAPMVAALLFTATVALQLPVTEAIRQALCIAASVHLPLVLILFGANLPSQLPEKRHATSVRSVLAIRLLSALAIGSMMLIGTPQTVEHAMRSAAVLCCLLAPISRKALADAATFRLNKSLMNSLSASSYLLSGLCMSVIALTAWSRDLVPIYSSMALTKTSTFPLLDQCVVLLVLLTAAAVFVPRLLVRKVVKMTISAEDFLKKTQQAQNVPHAAEPPEQGRPTAAGAVAVATPSRPVPAVRFSVAASRRRNRGAMLMQQRSFQASRTTKLC